MTDAEREYLISYLIGYLLGRRLEAPISPKECCNPSPLADIMRFTGVSEEELAAAESVKFCLAISKATYTLCFNATST